MFYLFTPSCVFRISLFVTWLGHGAPDMTLCPGCCIFCFRANSASWYQCEMVLWYSLHRAFLMLWDFQRTGGLGNPLLILFIPKIVLHLSATLHLVLLRLLHTYIQKVMLPWEGHDTKKQWYNESCVGTSPHVCLAAHKQVFHNIMKLWSE